jgi:hypothetical protein
MNPSILPKLVLVGLLSSASARATAFADYISNVIFTFNVPFASVTPQDNLFTVNFGRASAEAGADRVLPVAVGDLPEFYQQSEINVIAGNAALNQDGEASAYSHVVSLIRFEFGSTPTDLVITLFSYHQTIIASTDLPWNPVNQTGESLGPTPGLGSGGTDLLYNLDGIGFFGSRTFPGLTGEHILTVITDAREGAIAHYPYIPTPDSANTTLLLGSALALLGLAFPRFTYKTN